MPSVSTTKRLVLADRVLRNSIVILPYPCYELNRLSYVFSLKDSKAYKAYIRANMRKSCHVSSVSLAECSSS